MGNLTKDMTRLCQEIGGWRRDRGHLCQRLARDTKALKAGVQKLRTETKKTQTHLAMIARADRLSFVDDLKSQVFHLRQGHRLAFQQMGAENLARRRAFVAEVQNRVDHLQAAFRHSHSEMARKGRTFRRQCLSHLQGTVRALRQETADDLNGARWAFFGPSRAEKQEKAAAARLHLEKQEAQRRTAALAEAARRSREGKKPEKGK